MHLVGIKDEESLGPCLLEGINAGLEVELDGPIDCGKNLASECGIHRHHELDIHHLVVLDVGKPTLSRHLNCGLGPKKDQHDQINTTRAKKAPMNPASLCSLQRIHRITSVLHKMSKLDNPWPLALFNCKARCSSEWVPKQQRAPTGPRKDQKFFCGSFVGPREPAMQNGINVGKREVDQALLVGLDDVVQMQLGLSYVSELKEVSINKQLMGVEQTFR